jgi:hypothetical protein
MARRRAAGGAYEDPGDEWRAVRLLAACRELGVAAPEVSGMRHERAVDVLREHLAGAGLRDDAESYLDRCFSARVWWHTKIATGSNDLAEAAAASAVLP